jgi:hypothetical protein
MPLHISPALKALTDIIERFDYHHVLELGLASSGCIALFSKLRCRIHFEDLNSEVRQRVAKRIRKGEFKAEQFLSDYLSKSDYDVILVWDLFNYMTDQEIEGFFSFLSSHLKRQCLVYLMQYPDDKVPKIPRQFVIKNASTVEITHHPVRKRDFPFIPEKRLLELIPNSSVQCSFFGHEGMVEGIKEYIFKISAR